MPHVNQILKAVEHQPKEQKPFENPSNKVMDRLWEVMLETYDFEWERRYGLEPTAVWINALAGIAPEMIKVGLERMGQDQAFSIWPPRALQFRFLCLPRGEDMGLPSFDEAYAQATKPNTDKHQAVIYAINLMVDPFAFRQAKAEQARALFQEVWNKTLEFVMAGGELPEKAEEIEEVAVKADKDSDKVMESRKALGLIA